MASKNRVVLMAPGPIENDPEVLAAAGTQPLNQVGIEFVGVMQETLKQMQRALFAEESQPFIMAGSGSLGFEFTTTNLVQPKDRVLVCHTGFFADYFADCLRRYDADVTCLPSEGRGMPMAPGAVAAELTKAANDEEKSGYKMLTITHVDTSTSVLNDIGAVAKAARAAYPDILIAVDGVCSLGAEELRFDEWGVDIAFTASQKAFNTPPGLMLFWLSKRALAAVKPRSFYCDISRWLPVMKNYEDGKPAYFATPACSLVSAQNVALRQMLDGKYGGMEKIFATIKTSADHTRSELKKLGLELFSPAERQANTIISAFYPEGVDGGKFRTLVHEKGFELAGGLHKDFKTKYFRIGHMGPNVLEPGTTVMPRLIVAIGEALKECGHSCDVPSLDEVTSTYHGGTFSSL